MIQRLFSMDHLMFSNMKYNKGILHSLEINFRFAIDLGLPVVSMKQILQNVVDLAGKNEDFNHKFFLEVKDLIVK